MENRLIGANIGGIPEMLDDGVDGLLFRSGDTDALIEKMESMLEMNNEKIVDMGQSARRKIETIYNPELHYQKLMTIYKKAINGGN